MAKKNLVNEQKKHTLHLTINEQKYEWHQQYITGAEIRKLGNIPQEDEIFLKIKEPWDNELIKDDSDVDLARPGRENFISKKHNEPHYVLIIVNGRPKKWCEETISYEQVVKLAFENYTDNATTAYTVTYDNGPEENPQGSLVKGEKVLVKNKMIFNVTATNKS